MPVDAVAGKDHYKNGSLARAWNPLFWGLMFSLQVLFTPSHPCAPPAIWMRHLCKLPVPALWKKVQETRRPERPHGEVHEQVGGLANQSVQRLPHGVDLPLDHVDPLHPNHLGHLQPCHDLTPLWWTLSPRVSLDPRATRANRDPELPDTSTYC